MTRDCGKCTNYVFDFVSLGNKENVEHLRATMPHIPINCTNYECAPTDEDEAACSNFEPIKLLTVKKSDSKGFGPEGEPILNCPCKRYYFYEKDVVNNTVVCDVCKCTIVYTEEDDELQQEISDGMRDEALQHEMSQDEDYYVPTTPAEEAEWTDAVCPGLSEGFLNNCSECSRTEHCEIKHHQ